MKKVQQKEKQRHLEKHSIAHLFSFPIEEGIEVHEYQRDEWIIREGMRPDYLFYVIEGKAKIYITYQNGKVSLINFINTHDYIGEMELLHEVYYTKGIQASTRTICFAIPLIKCSRTRYSCVNSPNSSASKPPIWLLNTPKASPSRSKTALQTSSCKQRTGIFIKRSM